MLCSAVDRESFQRNCPRLTAAVDGDKPLPPKLLLATSTPAPTRTLALNFRMSEKIARFVRKDLKNGLKLQCRAGLWATGSGSKGVGNLNDMGGFAILS